MNSLPMNLQFVAAEVTRRIPLGDNSFRLITSAATSFRAAGREDGFRGVLSLRERVRGNETQPTKRAGPILQAQRDPRLRAPAPGHPKKKRPIPEPNRPPKSVLRIASLL